MAAGDARVPGGQGLLGGKLTDLKQRLLFVVGALVVYRIGTHIPVPGIYPVPLAEMLRPTHILYAGSVPFPHRGEFAYVRNDAFPTPAERDRWRVGA